MTTSARPTLTRSWPSLAELPALYPDARNRSNRGPFRYRQGRTWPLTGQPETADRFAVLAVGSNAYPRQLSDKFSGSTADLEGVDTIPVVLRDVDVAWCPVRSRKGYAPVTLAARPGAVCLTWMQWLTPKQLDIISATEGPRYDLVGGRPLASLLTMQPRWPRPLAVYAWWFDSLLQRRGETAWLDVYRRQSAVDFDLSEGVEHAAPSGWRRVRRDDPGRAIDYESMYDS